MRCLHVGTQPSDIRDSLINFIHKLVIVWREPGGLTGASAADLVLFRSVRLNFGSFELFTIFFGDFLIFLKFLNDAFKVRRMSSGAGVSE